MRLLSNATAVTADLPPARARQPRMVFAGRLIGWKAPLLALRALRYVRHPQATLHFYGQGYEQRRLERHARRWGIAARVIFHGWVPRNVLLDDLAGSAVLLHPALHEEAGLCIAEALAMGVPAVCLAHGGPVQVTGHWPQTPSQLVEPGDADRTARAIAAAADRFLTADPAPRDGPREPNVSFAQQLLAAYAHVGSGRDTAMR
ncbi:MAG: glycosyltransferase [Actinomycetota bacterium]|nr:glycosyltransferase [Actinomycetota bacterium]